MRPSSWTTLRTTGRIIPVKNRLLWAVFVIAMSGLLVMAVIYVNEVSANLNSLIWTLVIVPSVPACGAFLMWRRPANSIGGLLMLAGVTLLVLPSMLERPTLARFEQVGTQPWMWAPIVGSQMLEMCATALLGLVLIVLPDGRIRYPGERRFARWAWVAVPLPLLSLISNEVIIKADISFSGITDVPSPLVVESLVPYGEAIGALVSLGYMVFGIAIVLQFLRYRQAELRERKQTRWVLYAGTVAIVAGLLPYLLGELGVLPPMEHDFFALLASLPVLLLPVSVVVAVMEPKWIDVDIVIRRSVVYGALSFLILVLYIVAAASFGLAAESRLRIEVAIFLTVIVAVAFQPLRRWLQGLADRLVFGDRPTRLAAVTQLSASLDETADPTELLPRLVDTIQMTLRLRWVRAVLDKGASATAGSPVGEPSLSVAIGNGAERLGVIECGPRQEGSIDEEDVQLVQTLASQVGLAVANARLAGRIVNAAEAERRRIERNIHDGAQQELVALVARLGMTRTRADNGGVTAAELEALQEEARRILSDLRELAQGIHPSVLSDGGLLEAVEDRCAHLPIEVQLHAAPALRRQRFPDEIEGAAYFFVTESLANVLKHSGATSVEVSLTRQDGLLTLSIEDNGCGFDTTEATHNGLTGLSDRISALGGTVEFDSQPGSGTRMSASLPVS